MWALVTWATDQLHLGCKCNAGKRLQKGNMKERANLNRKKIMPRIMSREVVLGLWAVLKYKTKESWVLANLWFWHRDIIKKRGWGNFRSLTHCVLSKVPDSSYIEYEEWRKYFVQVQIKICKYYSLLAMGKSWTLEVCISYLGHTSLLWKCIVFIHSIYSKTTW